MSTVSAQRRRKWSLSLSWRCCTSSVSTTKMQLQTAITICSIGVIGAMVASHSKPQAVDPQGDSDRRGPFRQRPSRPPDMDHEELAMRVQPLKPSARTPSPISANSPSTSTSTCTQFSSSSSPAQLHHHHVVEILTLQ
jgi:hypothetical protein